MKPSIGRIVHMSVHGRRVPAIVTFMGEDDLPVLQALDGSGVTTYHAVYAEESAESAAQPNRMNTPNYTWAWPPRVP
jgi:hypothetical protein